MPANKRGITPPSQEKNLTGSPVSIQIAGSTESGGGTCLVVKDTNESVVIDCGANPRELGEFRQRMAQAILKARPNHVVITHGHYDHMGSLPDTINYFERQGIVFPPIVATQTTYDLIRRQLEKKNRCKLTHLTETGQIKMVENRHSIPGSAGILLNLRGNKTIFYTGDFHGFPSLDLPSVDLLIIDSTGAMRKEPRKDNEVLIRKNIVNLIEETLERNPRASVYVALFSTQLERAAYLEIEALRLTNFQAGIAGMSLWESLLAYRKDMAPARSGRFTLVTGVWAQGEANWYGEDRSVLVKMSRKEYPNCKFKKGDLVILSGSIPTWSPSIATNIFSMCKRICDMGVRVVVDTSAPEIWAFSGIEKMAVHCGGHGNLPEILSVVDAIRAKNPNVKVMPMHGSQQSLNEVAWNCIERDLDVIEASQGSIITVS